MLTPVCSLSWNKILDWRSPLPSSQSPDTVIRTDLSALIHTLGPEARRGLDYTRWSKSAYYVMLSLCVMFVLLDFMASDQWEIIRPALCNDSLPRGISSQRYWKIRGTWPPRWKARGRRGKRGKSSPSERTMYLSARVFLPSVETLSNFYHYSSGVRV